MADPTRPVQDAIIDPVWGQWVHDRVAADPFIQSATQTTTTSAQGKVLVTFPTPFRTGTVPVVVVQNASPNINMLVTVEPSIPPNATAFYVSTWDTTNHAVPSPFVLTFTWIAVGLRP